MIIVFTISVKSHLLKLQGLLSKTTLTSNDYNHTTFQTDLLDGYRELVELTSICSKCPPCISSPACEHRTAKPWVGISRGVGKSLSGVTGFHTNCWWVFHPNGGPHTLTLPTQATCVTFPGRLKLFSSLRCRGKMWGENGWQCWGKDVIRVGMM